MDKAVTDENELLELVRMFHEKAPFNIFLGLKISHLKADEARFTFSMKNELIGNFTHGYLHGGVISSVLDATGVITTTASVVGRMQGLSSDKIVNRIARFGTIDIRIDYLRPGRGTRFLSTGTVMRTGKKVAVTRMELKNQENVLIAVGTGTYIIG